MQAVLAYAVARLKEPGTMRSLIWVCMSLAGYSASETAVAEYATMGGALLGVLSAALPEQRK